MSDDVCFTQTTLKAYKHNSRYSEQLRQTHVTKYLYIDLGPFLLCLFKKIIKAKFDDAYALRNLSKKHFMQRQHEFA